MTQEQMEAALLPELRGFYTILKAFVKEGNCLIDGDDTVIRRIKTVKLAHVGKEVRGIVFTT